MEDRPVDFNITKVERVVEKVLVENQHQDLLYFTRIYRYWSVIVGEQLAKKTAPEKLVKGVLTVLVEDSAYSHQLRYFERNMLDLIASPEICGDNVVRKIAFRVGVRRRELTFAPEGNEEVKISPAPTQKEIQETYNQPVSSRISDNTLRRAFAKCMTRITRNRENKPVDKPAKPTGEKRGHGE